MSWVLSAVLALAGSSAAHGGASGHGGLWHCQEASESATDNPTGNWFFQFDLQLQPDGAAYAQGSFFVQSAGAYEPFTAEGRWQEAPDHQSLQVQAAIAKRSGRAAMQIDLNYNGDTNMDSRMTTSKGSLTSTCHR